MSRYRPYKHDYYLNIAEAVAQRGTCIRRNYGAIIVNNDEIISTGYTGAPRGKPNCADMAKCKREELGCAPGERYELCRSVHAEQNAIISAARRGMLGGTIYIVGIEPWPAWETYRIRADEPCLLCKKMIVNAGIKQVCYGYVDDMLTMMDVGMWVI